jgi:hypothetical protein
MEENECEQFSSPPVRRHRQQAQSVVGSQPKHKATTAKNNQFQMQAGNKQANSKQPISKQWFL